MKVTDLISIRVETCSLCQLACPLCPRHSGETDAVIGKGWMRAKDFNRILDANPNVRNVELGNFGEVFLNKELPDILRSAHEHGVVAEIDEGANLNDASEEALEALVQYQVAAVRCAIDGATQRSYEQYRVGGSLAKVLDNVRKINAYKQKYRSKKPRLIYQMVLFSHNEHETTQAALLAKMLGMDMMFKFNFHPESMPVQNVEKARQLLGYADRKEYLASEKKHVMRWQCYEMWLRPQVNWDGKLLGCSRNFWGYYAENVIGANLIEPVNNEKMQYAREMLMGKREERQDIPCVNCGVYRGIKRFQNWITEAEIASAEAELRQRLAIP